MYINVFNLYVCVYVHVYAYIYFLYRMLSVALTTSNKRT